MSHDLRDPLTDLLTNVPSYVVPDPQAAWAAGARRRTRRRVAGTGLAVVLVLLAGAGIAVLPRAHPIAPAGADGGVHGYPSRIDYPYWSRDLPERPGPVAGLVERDPGWQVVSPDGSLWDLPGRALNDWYPALSNDGTRLGFLRKDGPYEIHNLVTGDVTRFPQIGTGSFNAAVETQDRDHQYYLAMQAPSFWSPDAASLFLPGHPTAQRGGSVDGLVLGVDGSLREVDVPGAGSPHAVGWLPDGSLVWLRWRDTRQGLVRAASVLVTATDGTVLRSVPLQQIGRYSEFSHWTGTVSPDGRRLAIVEHGDDNEARVRTFDLASGGLRGTSGGVPDAPDNCLPSWRDDGVAVPTYSGDASTTRTGVVLAGPDSTPIVLADPRLKVSCSLWAVDALDGAAHRGLEGRLFGTDTSWLSWHWREAVAGLGALLVAVVLLAGLRRRRRRASVSE